MEEALKILMDCYLTDSIQTLRKWIREGKINATVTSYRQGGYKIMETDLISFIDEERPGLLDLVRVYKKTVEELPLSAMTLFKDHVKKTEYLKEETKEELNVDLEIKNNTPQSSSEIATKNEMQSSLQTEEVSLAVLFKTVEDLKQHVFKDEYLHKPMKMENNEEMEINTNSHQSVSEVIVKNEIQSNSQREEVNMGVLLRSMEELKQHVNNKFEKLDQYEEDRTVLIKKFETLDSKSEKQFNDLISEIEKLKEERKEVNNNRNKNDQELPKSKEGHQKKLSKYDFKKFFERHLAKNDIVLDTEEKKTTFVSLVEERYKLFYDDQKYFLEKKYYDDHQNIYAMKNEGKTETLKGKTRGELMMSYFNKVFCPDLKLLINEVKNTESPQQPTKEDNEGDREHVDLFNFDEIKEK
ncbi:hypothetical protein [Gottfriedia acidiceleris]|uniref:hypothetical protein n=1 Tax=Gottfriedia acidiceleris TaxID=371036 RepID=UPI00101CA71A|nr:hypothetical protein [Gottfriedia acidiceleris]